jgi:hypothetical protein
MIDKQNAENLKKKTLSLSSAATSAAANINIFSEAFKNNKKHL